MDAVIKIGGHLARGEHLQVLCEEVATLGQGQDLLIVPGGGEFADVVRQYDARLGLGDTAVHWMAILAMDQYGYLLVDLISGSVAVRTIEDAQSVAEEGRVPVLLPFDLVHGVDALPHTWTVTSDSIAAWVGGLSSAPALMLMKDSKGLDNLPAARGNSSLVGMTVEQLSAWDGVDGYLATVLGDVQLDLWILNGERPGRLSEVLETGRTTGIRLLRSDS